MALVLYKWVNSSAFKIAHQSVITEKDFTKGKFTGTASGAAT
jgi:hypothetical protein